MSEASDPNEPSPKRNAEESGSDAATNKGQSASEGQASKAAPVKVAPGQATQVGRVTTPTDTIKEDSAGKVKDVEKLDPVRAITYLTNLAVSGTVDVWKRHYHKH